jgi:hypothetical protein
MKSIKTLIFVLLAIFWSMACTEIDPDPDPDPEIPEDVEDITTVAEISPYGGEIQVTDESGNVITVTFPPAALRDTTVVTLTLLGEHKDLPIDQRQIRAFSVAPKDLSLYEAVLITVAYNAPPSNLESSTLFRHRSENWLCPLSGHSVKAGNSSITASSQILGEFAEGMMSLEQINTQLDLLNDEHGLSLKSTIGSSYSEKGYSSGCEEYKATWDGWVETAASFLRFFELRELLGYYDQLPPGEGSWEEDVNKVCSNVFEKGVNDVLNLGEPDDPCCSDYAEAISSMKRVMDHCGSQGSTFDQLSDRYDKVHSQCHTVLDITTEVNIESGGLLIMNTGEVTLSLQGTGNGEATVTGTGQLAVGGSGNAGGECTATIDGQTLVSVSGTRDAAYVYTLTLDMNQIAVMTTVCPGIVTQTNLFGGSPRQVILGPADGHSLSETEMIDEGTATIQASLSNPYIPVPDPS